MNDVSPCGADFREVQSIGPVAMPEPASSPVPLPTSPTSPPVDDAGSGAGTTGTEADATPGAGESVGGPIAAVEGAGGVTVPERVELANEGMEAYRLKLAGHGMSEIATKLGVDRTTIWRWIQRVETEAVDQLSKRPIFNIISEEIARLTDSGNPVTCRGPELSRRVEKQDRAPGPRLGGARLLGHPLCSESAYSRHCLRKSSRSSTITVR